MALTSWRKKERRRLGAGRCKAAQARTCAVRSAMVAGHEAQPPAGHEAQTL
jgi:hypothetical protein